MGHDVDRPFVRVATTGHLSPPGAGAARAAARFAGTPRRLPTIFGTPMIAHGLSSRVPSPARLRALVAGLHGRLAVVNPSSAVRAPVGLTAAVRGLVRACVEPGWVDRDRLSGGAPSPVSLDRRVGLWVRSPGDTRAAYERRMVRALVGELPPETMVQMAGGMTWTTVLLYESRTPAIHLDATAAAGGAPSAVAAAVLRYRLVVAAGSGPPADWPVLDAAAMTAPAIPWPMRHHSRPVAARPGGADGARPWFIVPMLVPDAWLAAHADRETLARWASLTGRAGSPDRYWFPETWDRFLEPGRRIGCLSPTDVWRPRRGRLAAAARGEQLESDDASRRSPAFAPATLTPDLERGVCVPPGYALVQCVGVLSVSVVVL